MAHRDGPSIDIDSLNIQVQQLEVGEYGDCECLADFEVLDLGKLHADVLQEGLDGFGRGDAEVNGFSACVCVAYNSGQGLEIVFLELILTHEHQGAARIVDLRGVGCRHNPGLAEHGLQKPDLLLDVPFVLVVFC